MRKKIHHHDAFNATYNLQHFTDSLANLTAALGLINLYVSAPFAPHTLRSYFK